MSARKAQGDCQPLAGHSQLRQGPVGQQQTAHPGTCQGSKADFPNVSPFPAAQGVLPSSHAYELYCGCHLCLFPLCFWCTACPGTAVTCIKPVQMLWKSDVPPALPFHKAYFHQHCIWSFFLTFRGCSVNS